MRAGLFAAIPCLIGLASKAVRRGLGSPVDGRRFIHRLKDSTERAGVGCKARLGPLGHLLFI